MRAVFDTNVVVSALVFPAGRLSWLRDAWRRGALVPLVSDETVVELLRVFAYPKFRLTEQETFDLLEDYLPYAETVVVPPDSMQNLWRADDPVCRDPHDEKFLALALAGGADALITGDRDLLAVDVELPFPIMTAAELAERV